MRTLTIVGARPQFIKLAPVSREMQRVSEEGGARYEDLIVHTGQHYDPELSGAFFEELGIPEPVSNLAIGSGPHGDQTARMLSAIEELLEEHRPDVVVVYGDTNSTLAGALAAAKLHIPIAHIEAGLRSFDRQMPEEVNRIVTDHVSDLLLAPTRTAMTNLQAENLAERARFVGDVMFDAVLFNKKIAAEKSTVLEDLGLQSDGYALVTIHRASNTEPVPLRTILDALNEVAATVMPLVFPVHPRTRALIKASCPDWQPDAKLQVIAPVGYLDMLRLLENARLMVTDSGGVQKEAYFVQTPCITLRDTTEWPETLQAGANRLVPIDHQAILAAASGAIDSAGAANDVDWAGQHFGNGNAAAGIVSEIKGLSA